MVGQGVGVDRHHQRRPFGAGAGHALLERDEDVARARRLDAVAALFLEQGAQVARDGQGDNLLVGARDADGARVFAAVAGIEHHDGGFERASGRSGRAFGRGRFGSGAPERPDRGGHHRAEPEAGQHRPAGRRRVEIHPTPRPKGSECPLTR
jgi:hypothetical protein